MNAPVRIFHLQFVTSSQIKISGSESLMSVLRNPALYINVLDHDYLCIFKG